MRAKERSRKRQSEEERIREAEERIRKAEKSKKYLMVQTVRLLFSSLLSVWGFDYAIFNFLADPNSALFFLSGVVLPDWTLHSRFFLTTSYTIIRRGWMLYSVLNSEIYFSIKFSRLKILFFMT